MSPEEQPEQPETAPPTNSAPTAEEMEAIKAQLEEERKAKAAAEAALASKDARIAELEGSLSEAKTGIQAATDELTNVKEAATKVVAKYLDAVARASTSAGAVKANLEAEAKEAKVPAGAPPRAEISPEGLSPREKIAEGIKAKGGTS